eukprot:1039160-Lingulodinium_polyedra.AAC.1
MSAPRARPTRAAGPPSLRWATSPGHGARAATGAASTCRVCKRRRGLRGARTTLPAPIGRPWSRH